MIGAALLKRSRWVRHRVAALACGLAASLTACGGGGSNPFDNPGNVNNSTVTGGQNLAFAYFQKCIQPILVSQTCSASGCHDNVNGTGGALRLIPGAAQVDLSNPSNTAASIRDSDMYKNFYSSQGSSVIGSAAQSKLLNKPLVRGVLHGGGLIFQNAQDPNVILLQYWVNHPAPQSGDEFSTSTYASMFTPAFDPANPAGSTCNTQ
jgi:hypothetical protein